MRIMLTNNQLKDIIQPMIVLNALNAKPKGETPMTFGEKLQALRKARGWSQEELATQINVSRQALSKWESGVSHS